MPVPIEERATLTQFTQNIGVTADIATLGDILEIPEPTCVAVSAWVQQQVQYLAEGTLRSQDGLKDLRRSLDRAWDRRGLTTSQKLFLWRQAQACYWTISDEEHQLNRYLTSATTVARVNAHNEFMTIGRYAPKSSFTARLQALIWRPALALKRVH